MKKKITFLILVLFYSSLFSQNSNFLWQSIGPLPNGKNTYKNTGRTREILTLDNNKTLLLGTSTGGLWKSKDGGKNWYCTTDSIPAGVNAIAVFHKSNRKIIFAAFSFFANGLFRNSRYSYGVFYSTDKGETWKPTALKFKPEQKVYITDIRILDEKIIVTSFDSVYFSKDLGRTWNKYNIKLKENQSFYQFRNLDNGDMLLAGNNCLFISKNNGRNWENLLPDSLTKKTYVRIDAFKNTFWAVFESRKIKKNLVVKYTNSGKNQEVYEQYLTLKHYAIGVWALNDSVIFIGGISLYYSKNGGKKNKYLRGDYHVDIRDVYFADKNNHKKIYVSTDGGLFYTEDLKNFKLVSPIPVFQCYSVSVSNEDSCAILTGLHDNGTLYRNKKGYWSHVLGGDGAGCLLDDSAKNQLAYITHYLRYRKDFRPNWKRTRINTHFIGLNPVRNPYYDTILYAGAYSKKKNLGVVKRSDNNGRFFTNNLATYTGGHITAIDAVNDSVETIYYAGALIWNKLVYTLNKTVYYDDTLKKTRIIRKVIKNDSNRAKISDIYCDKINSNKVWYTVDGFDEDNKVWFSDDNGKTWMNLSFNLPNLPVYSVYYNNKHDLLLIGNDNGVYYLDKYQWKRFGKGLPFVAVTEFDLNTATNVLYISTYGRGLWKTQL